MIRLLFVCAALALSSSAHAQWVYERADSPSQGTVDILSVRDRFKYLGFRCRGKAPVELMLRLPLGFTRDQPDKLPFALAVVLIEVDDHPPHQLAATIVRSHASFARLLSEDPDVVEALRTIAQASRTVSTKLMIDGRDIDAQEFSAGGAKQAVAAFLRACRVHEAPRSN